MNSITPPRYLIKIEIYPLDAIIGSAFTLGHNQTDINDPFPSLELVFNPPGQASKIPPGHLLNVIHIGGVCLLNGIAQLYL